MESRRLETIVINTGTEILLGDVINTHLAFIAQEIFPLGLRVGHQLTVPDGPAIGQALTESLDRADIIVVTGGLGPTTDDITREVVAKVLELELHSDSGVLEAISRRAARRGFRLIDRMSRQADVPEGATVLPNEYGSAPGLYLPAQTGRRSNPHLFLLPGPPRELRPMFKSAVVPILRNLVAEQSGLSRKTYRIAGMGESLVEEAVGERLLALGGIEVGYCARSGEVDLRIIGQPALLDVGDKIIMAVLGDAVFSRGNETLTEVIVNLLRDGGKTLAVAESCTGGYLAHRITNVPGASTVFLTGYVTYANDAKSRLLGVNPEMIARYGAVSEAVARAMAEGARKDARANISIATTGIAGPSGGTETKPVGTVFIALASESRETVVRQYLFQDDRPTFKELASQAALEMLRRFLLV